MSTTKVTPIRVRPGTAVKRSPDESILPPCLDTPVLSGMRSMKRPQTAPAKRHSFMDGKARGKPKKSFRLNIRALMSVDGGKREEGMVSVLLRRVRKAASTQKRRIRQLSFQAGGAPAGTREAQAQDARFKARWGSSGRRAVPR